MKKNKIEKKYGRDFGATEKIGDYLKKQGYKSLGKFFDLKRCDNFLKTASE